MKKSKVVETLSPINPPRDYEAIREVIEHISENEELLQVENFRDYCEFILTTLNSAEKLKEDQRLKFQGICNGYLDELKLIIQEYGIPKKGELNHHAKRILHILESHYPKELDNPFVRKSYELVRDYSNETTHSKEYGMHLNHLNEIIMQAQKERKASHLKTGIDALV